MNSLQIKKKKLSLCNYFINFSITKKYFNMKKLLFYLTLIIGFVFTSCSKDDSEGSTTEETVATSITLTASKTNAFQGDEITLVTKTDTGRLVTAASTFYVNGLAISGSSFTVTSAGTVEVYATHVNQNNQTLTSNTVQITVSPAINFNKRVLIEDFTGTWCGYCPRVSHAINLVNQQTNDATVVAIHRGDDPYNFSAASVLEDQIGLAGYPTAMLNRTTGWNYPEPSYVNQVVALTTGSNPRLGLALETTTSGSTSTVNVKVKFGQNYSNLKLVVYVLENNLIYNQENYTSYFGGASVLTNFEHDHVLRGVLSSSILGESIAGSFVLGEEFQKSFTYNIPSNINASNIEYVAVVMNSAGSALNSRKATGTEVQGFEEE